MTTPFNPSFHALRFGRSASHYDAHAGVQARMAEALLSLWGDRPAPSRLLEFGCGTGLLTRRLRTRFPATDLLATDASPEMLAVAEETVGRGVQETVQSGGLDFAPLDARGTIATKPLLSFHASHFPVDALASGALVQWFPDLTAHLRFAANCAAPRAAYLVSGFDRTNFPELNALLSAPPFSYSKFPGHAQTTVETAASESGWTIAGYLAWEDAETMPDARAVLRRMQDLGSVRDPREGGRMTRANLAYLLTEYERRFSVEGGGVRLTWRPWAALLTRA